MQGMINANTRLTGAVGRPTPGNRNDCRAYRDSGVDRQCHGATVLADGGYQGNPQVIMPYRAPAGGSPLPGWKHDVNTVRKRVRARLERTGAHKGLERPTQLPTQTRRCLVRHPRCRSDTQPRHDPLTIPTSPRQPHSPTRAAQLIITGQPLAWPTGQAPTTLRSPCR
jgi:hypothetical protein